MRRNCRSARGGALRRRGRVALRTVLHGNRRVRAYCGSYARADVLPHDGPAVGPADSVALRGTDDGPAVCPTDAVAHRATDDDRSDDAGALTSADDGRAVAAAHARSHGRAFARADASTDAAPHARADARADGNDGTDAKLCVGRVRRNDPRRPVDVPRRR